MSEIVPAPPFDSLEAVRAEHKQRLQQARWSRTRSRERLAPTEWADEAEMQEGEDDLAAFVARIQSTGTVVEEEAERRSLQAIFDFWAAELAARDIVGDFGFTAVPRLARYREPWPPEQTRLPSSRTNLEAISDVAATALETMAQLPRVVQEAAATIAGHVGGLPSATLQTGATTQSETDGQMRPRQRPARPVAAPTSSSVSKHDKLRGEIIRIAGIARQWRDDPLDGYLLSGNALAAADELCKRVGPDGTDPAIVRDKDIALFLNASKRYAAETTQLKSKYLYAIIALLAVALMWAGWKWYQANIAQIEAVRSQNDADAARRRANSTSALAQEQAARAEQARAEAEEARTAAEKERDNAVEARRQTENALATAQLQSFNARQALREADAERASAEAALGELRKAHAEATRAQRELAGADAERRRAVSEAEAELRRAGAAATADELSKANAAISPLDALNAVVGTLKPSPSANTPIGAGNDERIEELTARLVEADAAGRAAVVSKLASVLSGADIANGMFVDGVDRMTSLLAVTSADNSLRDSALAVLVAIPEALWDANPQAKAIARATVGLLEQSAKAGFAPLSSDGTTALRALKARIGWAVPAAYRVDFQFAGFTRAQANAVSGALKSVGWRIDGEERTPNAAGFNQIRYGDPKDSAAAELLAADARRAGASPNLRAIRVAGIQPGNLEVWVSR